MPNTKPIGPTGSVQVPQMVRGPESILYRQPSRGTSAVALGSSASRGIRPATDPSARINQYTFLPLVADAFSMLLALRAESDKEQNKVRRGQVNEAKVRTKELEQARKKALKAAEEALKDKGIFGTIMSVVKAVAVAAAAVMTVTTGGLGGVALAGALMLLLADPVKDILVEMGVDPKVANLISMGMKIAGGAMMGGAGAVQAGISLGGQMASMGAPDLLKAFGASPEVQAAVLGVLTITVAVASALTAGGGAGDAAEKAAEELNKKINDIVEKFMQLSKIINQASSGVRNIGDSLFNYTIENHQIDAKEIRMAFDTASEYLDSVIESMKEQMKHSQRFKKAASDALAVRNEAQTAATRNLA